MVGAQGHDVHGPIRNAQHLAGHKTQCKSCSRGIGLNEILIFLSLDYMSIGNMYRYTLTMLAPTESFIPEFICVQDRSTESV